MDVRVYHNGPQDPTAVRIELPNWTLGGTREAFVVSMWEAIRIWQELDRMFRVR